MLRLSDFTRGLTLRRVIEMAVGAVILGLILKVATFVLSPITLQSMREFQCARLNDFSQFNPRQLSALSWASFDAPGGYGANMSPPIIRGYGLVNDRCLQTEIVEPRYAAHVAMCRESALGKTAADVERNKIEPPSDRAKQVLDLMKATENKRLSELPLSERLKKGIEQAGKEQIASPQFQYSARLKDCLSQPPEQSGHWAYRLQQTTVGKIGVVALLTTPVLAVADMIYHTLFELSATAVINWICLAYGLLMALFLARRFDLMDTVLVLALIPVLTIAFGSAFAVVIQYVMDLSLRWFGSGLEYIAMISGTAAGAFLIAITRDVAAATGEKVVGAVVESSVKAAINPETEPMPDAGKTEKTKPT